MFLFCLFTHSSEPLKTTDKQYITELKTSSSDELFHVKHFINP